MLPFGENDFLPEALSSAPFLFLSIAWKFLRVLRKIIPLPFGDSQNGINLKTKEFLKCCISLSIDSIVWGKIV